MVEPQRCGCNCCHTFGIAYDRDTARIEDLKRQVGKWRARSKRNEGKYQNLKELLKEG